MCGAFTSCQDHSQTITSRHSLPMTAFNLLTNRHKLQSVYYMENKTQ